MTRICTYMLLWIIVFTLAPRETAAQEKKQDRISQDTVFIPVKVITREDIRTMGAGSLYDVLRYELNLEVEQYPADGGAFARVTDLDSRYFKILVNGIPIGGSEMFGGRADISGIALNNVDAIRITTAPMGVQYGSGTLTGIADIITHKIKDSTGTTLNAYIQEESAGPEYNLRSGVNAKGRRQQSLALDHRFTNGITIGASALRTGFNGLWGTFNGKQYVQEPSAQRGFEWSPYTSWNADGYLSYQGRRLSAFYTYSHFYSGLTFYGHGVQQEFDNGVPLDLYTATDYRYINSRERHHLRLQGNLRGNLQLSADLSYQEGITKRKITKVNTGNNEAMDHESPLTLYATKTWYAKIQMAKPVTGNLEWRLGVEMDRTNGFISAAAGTYQSRETNKAVFSTAGFTWLQWQPGGRFALQPGIRVSTNGLYKAYPTASLTANYNPDPHNHFRLIVEQVRRFPNHRELFTYLDTELNLLEGNTHLNPETGNAVLLYWQNQLKHSGALRMQITAQSAFRYLKDRIVIAPAPYKIPTQDAYQYTNANSYYSWQHTATLTACVSNFSMTAGIALLGLKGNDYADAARYDKFLYHTEASAVVRYRFNNGYWLRTNYRFVSRQSVYSYERELPSPELIRVYNQAPTYHLLDVNAGKSFFRQKLAFSIGGRDLINVNQVNFSPTDGQEHYSGDLRTIYPGYGRGWYARLSYSI